MAASGGAAGRERPKNLPFPRLAAAPDGEVLALHAATAWMPDLTFGVDDVHPHDKADPGAVRAAVAPVCVALCTAGEIWGGVEQLVLTLAEAMPRQGLDAVTVLFHEGLLAKKLRDRGLAVEVLNKHAKYDPRVIGQVRAVFRRHRVRVLHVHGYKATLIAGLAARGLAIRVLKTEHGCLEPLADWRSLGSHARLAANVAVDRVASKRLVDGVAFVSHDICARSGAYPNHVVREVIYNGIDPPSVRVASTGASSRSRRHFNIGIVGRVTKVKGHQDLLNAFARLSHLDDLRLHVFGTGPVEMECRRWCQQTALTEKVCFHGFTSAIHDAIAALDVLVIPSLHEGLPYALLEAMHLNVPVIASRVGGLREVLERYECGLLVPRNDPESLATAIEQLYRRPDLRAELTRKAQEAARRHFPATNMVRRYAGMYRQLIQA